MYMRHCHSRLSGMDFPAFSATILTPKIRHYYPNAEQRFPALGAIPQLNPWRALLLSGGICEL